MKNPIILSVTLCLLSIFNNFGQNSRELPINDKNTVYIDSIKTLNIMSRDLTFIDTKKSMKYAEMALNLSLTHDYKIGEAYAYRNFSNQYIFNEMYPLGMDYIEKSIAIFENQKDSIGLANCYISLGFLYRHLNNIEDEIKYYKLSYDIFNKLNIPERIGVVLHNLGESYYNSKDFENSRRLTLIAIDINKSTGQTAVLSACYKVMGLIELSSKDYDKSEAYFHKALGISEKLGKNSQKTATLESMINIAEIYKIRKEHDKQIKILNKASVLSKTYNISNYLPKIYNELILYYSKENDQEMMQHYFTEQKAVTEIIRLKNMKGKTDLVNSLISLDSLEKENYFLEQTEILQNKSIDHRNQLLIISAVSLILLIGFVIKLKFLMDKVEEINLALKLQNEDKAKRVDELIIVNREKTSAFIELNKAKILVAKNEEKEKHANELAVVNKELSLQNEEIVKREEALIKSKEKIEKSDELYRFVIAVTNLGVWDWNVKGDVLYFSKLWKAQLGYKESELENLFSTWQSLLHPDDYNKANKGLEDFLKNPSGRYLSEFRLRHKDGSYIWISARAEAIINNKKEVVRMFGSHTDISARKISVLKLKDQNIELIRAKDKAEESDRLKTAFLSNMSHEIRTPMNGILGFSELLKEPNLTGETQREYIGVIEKSGERMLNILNDIVSISKIESGLMEVSMQGTDISKQIGFIHSFFKLEIEGKEIRFLIKNSLKAKEAYVFSDSEKIYGILTNLIKNAVKFTEEGTIELGCHLRTGKASSELEFYVKDTGIGVPKDRQKAIFDRFVQADVSGKMAYQGAGLGLSISKAYVELLGGKIWMESEEGKGSVFSFTLPYLTEQNKKNIAKNES